MMRLWVSGLISARSMQFFGSIAGVALTVAILATIGSFVSRSAADMTVRAIQEVPVDWQIAVLPGVDPASMEQAARDTVQLASLDRVQYADVQAFEATAGGTVQTTGSGKVLGIPAGYPDRYPGQFRLLLGQMGNVLLAQQTAANLHVGPGDTIRILLSDGPATMVKVSGIVELANADAMFQAIGAPPGSAPQAPPDNVLILSLDTWYQVFGALTDSKPGSIQSQLHAKLVRQTLPSDPVAAHLEAEQLGRHFGVQTTGSALLANNLAARLEAVREDALYARLLFLFLALPGALLAALLTVILARATTEHRRRDQFLLRVCGVSLEQIVLLSAAEALLEGLAGATAGLLVAELISRALFGASIFVIGAVWWSLLSAVLGLLLAFFAVLLPAWRNARLLPVRAEANIDRGPESPLWQRIWLDVLFILIGAGFYWRSAATGYQVVLAPEGVAATAVDYSAFLAPLLIAAGLGLATLRFVNWAIAHGRNAAARVLRPIAGALSETVAATLVRQSRRITIGVATTALAFAFAASTAIFNATYQAQARVDAELTNGSDVTVAGSIEHPVSRFLDQLSKVPGLAAAEPMQHRYAYVGSDLQDLYGIDAGRISRATTLSNAYFANGDAKAALADLATTKNGVFVSQETVNDYQLAKGDTINLRLQFASDHQYHSVPFTIVGVVREFPTAPKDSFVVANHSYITEATGAPEAEILLIRATGDPEALASGIRSLLQDSPGAKVTSIGDAVRTVGSSLTAVDLSGLTKLELAFALLMVAAAAGLTLMLRLADRRRTFAILAAIGTRPAQLGAFIWSEALLMLFAGAAIGTAVGIVIAFILVKLLTGIFDPPPDTLVVPWLYLFITSAVAAGAVFAAAIAAQIASAAEIADTMRRER